MTITDTGLNIKLMGTVKTDIKVKRLKAIKKDKVIHLRLPAFIFKTVEDVAKDNKCTNSEVVRALVLEKFLSGNRINFENVE